MKLSRRDFLRVSGLGLGAWATCDWRVDAAVPEPGMASSDKHALADIAMETARRLNADYADIRINRYRNESIATREERVLRVSRDQSFGFGVRILYRGTWGFSASREVSAASVRRVVRQAFEIARANAPQQRRRIELAPCPPVQAVWRGAFQTDPFEIDLEPKIERLLTINAAALGRPGVAFVSSWMDWVNEQKFFASSEGSRIEQYLIRGYPSFEVTAVDRSKGDFQTRRSFGGPQSLGYEYMDQHDWIAEAEQAAEEAVGKLTARPVAPGKYDLVLHPSHLWLTIHESVGHSTELDRALGWEANFAGTSFLTPERTGKLQFGSPIVNFFADRTQPQGLATVGFDDEGVAGTRWHLVKDGLFIDWQTTRDLAPLIGRTESYGCLHAESWAAVPFPRMPNVSLQPSRNEVALEDLVRGVDNGILIYGDGSYSIDQQRYNFQFGGQTFWEIKQGKITEQLRDVAYQSRTTDFWNACDGLGGPATYSLGGTFRDGKGEPVQINAVSHGAPVARFRDISVLNTGASTGGGGRHSCS